MTSPDVEHILCARTADLPPAWLPPHGALPLDEGALLDTLERTEPHWLPRPAAESDPTHKQWIPYILLCTRDDLLAVYPRRGSETRLHGLWSCGIGGHINPVDQPPDTAAADRRAFWQRTLHNGLQRELREEFPSAAAGIT
ncbi:MAG: phosphoesterase, partial [Verrucomicrobia bacterium]